VKVSAVSADVDGSGLLYMAIFRYHQDREGIYESIHEDWTDEQPPSIVTDARYVEGLLLFQKELITLDGASL